MADGAPDGALDLRTVLAAVRRRRLAVTSAALAGLLAGVMIIVLDPPTFSSRVLVVLPAVRQSVYSPAALVTLPSARPAFIRSAGRAISAQTLRADVSITAIAPSVVSVAAAGPTAARARRLAGAAAARLVSYLNTAPAPYSHMPARILGSATEVTGPAYRTRLAVAGVCGTVIGALAGVGGALAGARRRRECGAGSQLVSGRFLRERLRRRAWAWCGTAAAGLAVGASTYVLMPPSYSASASVLLATSPYIDPTVAITSEVAWSRCVVVARAVVRQLKLDQTAGAFLDDYSVTAVSDRVLLITVSGAPTREGAVRWAAATAAQLLRSRAALVSEEARLGGSWLGPQISQARQREAAASAQVIRAGAQAPSRAERRRLARLVRQRAADADALALLRQQDGDFRTSAASMTAGSRVLEAAAPLPGARAGGAVLRLGGGMAVGAALGMGTVLIAAVLPAGPGRREKAVMPSGRPVSAQPQL